MPTDGEWSSADRWPSEVSQFAGHAGAVAAILSNLRSLPGHAFWPDDISLLDHPNLKKTRLLDSSQVTDTYLLGLARARNGQLATFDSRMITDAVKSGAQSLHVIR
jgi:hypothetical protein